jgi:hypothetical protein
VNHISDQRKHENIRPLSLPNKDEVTSSNLVSSSTKIRMALDLADFLIFIINFKRLYVNSWGHPKWKHRMERR